MSTILLNWNLLVQQGRARAPGIPWTDAEWRAITELGIPADVVRQGVLTREAYERQLRKESILPTIPLYRMKHEDLVARVRAFGVPIADPEVMTRTDLMDLIRVEEAKRADATDWPLETSNVERVASA